MDGIQRFREVDDGRGVEEGKKDGSNQARWMGRC